MREFRANASPPDSLRAEATPRIKRASGMGRAEAWFVHLANLSVAITGVVFGLFRWLVGPVDEFSLTHPWQPAWQHLHILAAPLLVFGIGLIWRDHAMRLVRSSIRARRRSGWALLGCAVPMVLSGYLLQATGDPSSRNVYMWTHVTTSSVWIAAYLVHQFAPGARSYSR